MTFILPKQTFHIGDFTRPVIDYRSN